MAALPTIRQLQYLVVLAEEMHFTNAAQRCFVSQSTFSSGIKELEDILGGALFERTNKQVRLTTLGELAVERARQIVHLSEDLSATSQHMRQPFIGDLHIAIIPTIAPFLIVELTAQIKQRFPELMLHLHELQTEHALRALRDNVVEFAIVALPLDGHNFEHINLAQDRLDLVIHRNHPFTSKLLQQQSLDVEQLSLNDLILLEEGHCLRDHVLTSCGKQQEANRLIDGIQLQANSVLTMLSMVDAKMGYTLMPQIATQSHLLRSYPQLQVIRLKQAPHRTLSMLVRPSSHKKRELHALALILTRIFTALPNL